VIIRKKKQCSAPWGFYIIISTQQYMYSYTTRCNSILATTKKEESVIEKFNMKCF